MGQRATSHALQIGESLFYSGRRPVHLGVEHLGVDAETPRCCAPSRAKHPGGGDTYISAMWMLCPVTGRRPVLCDSFPQSNTPSR